MQRTLLKLKESDILSNIIEAIDLNGSSVNVQSANVFNNRRF